MSGGINPDEPPAQIEVEAPLSFLKICRNRVPERIEEIVA
jgi:hypothetical protein